MPANTFIKTLGEPENSMHRQHKGYVANSHYLRQSRRLVNVNRSKRFDYEPPEGGYSSNIIS